MIGANHAIACVDRSAFDDREDIALYAFAAHVGSVARLAPRDFIYFVDIDYSHLLGAFHRGARHLIHVQQFAFFFLDQVLEGVGHGHLAFLFLLAKHPAQHFLEVDVHLLDALIGNDFERRHHLFADFDIHHALVEFAFAQLRAQFFARALVLFALRGGIAFRGAWECRWRRGKQNVQHALFRCLLSALRDFVQFFFAHHVNGHFHQVADHRFHIAAYIADFRVFRRFYFYERAGRHARQAPCDFRFTHAGGANHQNVFWQYIFGNFRRQLLSA